MRVLVVEDEALVALLLKDMLSDLGHEVTVTAGRLQDALNAADEGTFDFAVLDVNVRGEPTFEVGQRLQARGIPFFFATGYGAAGLGPEWSAQPLLSKPFVQGQLEAAIAQCLGGRDGAA